MKNGDLAWVQGEAGHNDALTGKTPVTFASGVRCWFKSEELTPAEGMVVVDARELEALRVVARASCTPTVVRSSYASVFAAEAENLRYDLSTCVYETEEDVAEAQSLADAYAMLAALEKERGA